MTYYAPTVQYNSGSSATWYTLTGIQSVSITRGRQRFQDAISQTSMVIELIPATSYTVPLAIGQPIDCRSSDPSSPGAFFQGRITDIQRSYDFPYNSGTSYAPADRIRITCTGGLGTMAISQLNTFGWTGPCIAEVGIQTMTSVTTINLLYTQLALSPALVSTQTFPDDVSVMDVTTKLVQSAQLTIDDYDEGQAIGATQLGVVTYPTGYGSTALTFSDAGGGVKYSGLEFLSSVQNTFNKITVQAEGLAEQYYQAGVAPFNPLQYATYSATTTDAYNLATYLGTMLSGQVQVAPYVVSTNTAVDSSALTGALMVSASNTNPPLGKTVNIAFRGTNYQATAIGLSLSFTPDRGYVQWFLSPSLGTPFTLDSTAFGVLDTNRLGYP